MKFKPDEMSHCTKSPDRMIFFVKNFWLYAQSPDYGMPACDPIEKK